MSDSRLTTGALGADLEVVDDPTTLPPTTPRHILLRLGVINASHDEQQAALDRWFAAPDAPYPPNLVGMLERRGYQVNIPTSR